MTIPVVLVEALKRYAGNRGFAVVVTEAIREKLSQEGFDVKAAPGFKAAGKA